MIRRHLRLLPILGLVAALGAGCSIKSQFLQTGSKAQKPVAASEVRVYATQNVSFRYTVIGGVTVDTMGNGDDAMKLLREQAASMGANAVVGARLSKLTSYVARTGLTGTAVRTQ